jgi:PAS domain S-box-containing protein
MEGIILYANRASEKLTGYSRMELLGTNISQFLPDEMSLTMAREVRRKLLVGKEIKQPYEQHFQRKDGTIGILRMATSSVMKGDEIIGFQHIARDVTEEQQAQENMRFYVQEIIRAQEFERKRIARELHDDVSPQLLLLIQKVDGISSSPHFNLSNEVKTKMEALRCQAVEALESLRRIAQDLRPRILDDLGLIAALEWMVDDLIMHHGIEAQVKIEGSESELPSELQLLLFRIAQEALNNIRKHAQATMVIVTIKFENNRIRLWVSDNGRGFSAPQRLSDIAATGKLGLAGMQERGQLIGGKVRIISEPGKGTTISAEIPNRQKGTDQLKGNLDDFESLISRVSGN